MTSHEPTNEPQSQSQAESQISSQPQVDEQFESQSQDHSQTNPSEDAQNHDEAQSNDQADDNETELTIRSLISTKDAGIIIGKGGCNVEELRNQLGVKASVSRSFPGLANRILSIGGTIDGITKAYAVILTLLNKENSKDQEQAKSKPETSSLKILISNNLMGNIIGKQGTTIKRIRDVSGARMIASKDMLPQSTERIIEIQGEVKSITSALKQILNSMAADWNRYSGTVLYNPQFSELSSLPSNYLLPGALYTTDSVLNKPYNGGRNSGSAYSSSRPDATVLGGPRDPAAVNGTSHLITQTMSIPKDMVGCIIGKAGSKISEIRRLSGSRISISKEEDSPIGERTFTILGTAEANQKALNLLYGQMQFETERRQKLSQDLKTRARPVGNGNLIPSHYA